MKKNLFVFSLVTLFFAQSALAHEKLSWHNAQKAIIKKAENILNTYDPEICMWTIKTYQIVLAPEYETEAWQISERVIKDILPKLPVYAQALENPFDDIYWSELVLQASMMGGQLAAQIHDTFEFGAKVCAIIGGYIDVLKETIRKK